MPHIPFLSKKANTSPFYGPDDEIPILVTILMGIQRKDFFSIHQYYLAENLTINFINHLDFLAVIGGIISPTIMISGQGSSFLNLDQDTRQYMVSASLIVSGLMRYCSTSAIDKKNYHKFQTQHINSFFSSNLVLFKLFVFVFPKPVILLELVYSKLPVLHFQTCLLLKLLLETCTRVALALLKLRLTVLSTIYLVLLLLVLFSVLK